MSKATVPCQVVLVTAPDDDTARRLAAALLEARAVACVNVLPGVTSFYRWQGKLEEDREVLLICKTRPELVPAVESILEREHPYDTPECVALEVAHVEPRYLAWLVDSTEPETPES